MSDATAPGRMLVGLLVAHDPTGQHAVDRVLARLRQPHLVRSVTPAQLNTKRDSLPDVVRDDFVSVPPDRAYPVVHIAGEHPDERHGDAVSEVRERLHEEFPALLDDPWLVLVIGQELDEEEAAFLRQVAADAGVSRAVPGVLVCTGASKVAVGHAPEEACAFAADLALALLGSRLAQELRHDPRERVWAAAATSLSYQPAGVASAAASWLASRSLERLAAPVQATDPAELNGDRWVADLGLADAERDSELLLAAGGRSLAEQLSASDVDLTGVEPAAWADTLTARHDLLVLDTLPKARQRVDDAAERRARALEGDLRMAVRDRIASTVSLEGGHRWGEGAARRLAREDAELAARATTEGTPVDLRPTHRGLARAGSRRPGGLALLVRVVVLAVAVGLLLARLDRGSAWLPVVGALIVGGLGTFQWWWSGRRLRRARLRHERAIQRRLRKRLHRHVLDRRRSICGRLRAVLGPAGELDRIRHLQRASSEAVPLLAEASDRRGSPAVEPTRFAVDLPHPEDLPGPELARRLRAGDVDQLDRRVAEVVAALPGDIRSEAVADEACEALVPLLRPQGWTGLADLLEQDPATADRAQRLLRQVLTPALPLPEGGQMVPRPSIVLAPPDLRRLSGVAQPAGLTASLAAAPAATGLDLGSLGQIEELLVPDVAVVVHLTPVPHGVSTRRAEPSPSRGESP